MKKLLIIFIWLISQYSFAQTTWVLDPDHSSIQFEVSHMSLSTVTGSFTSYSGVLTSKKNEFENATINVTIQAGSITTNNLQRDKHLKADDFFAVDKYPEIKFSSTSFTEKSNNNYIIKGDLTIRGVTKSVTLMAEYKGIVSLDNQKKAGFTATTTINRFDYGLKWDDVLDNGGLIVGEKVKINLNIELIKQ